MQFSCDKCNDVTGYCMRRFGYWIVFSVMIMSLRANVVVVSLHPLLTDALKQIGGDAVEVVDLIGLHGDPHHFEPTPDQLAKVQAARLYFVSGKGLESYLPSLRSMLAGRATVVEVGETLPSLKGKCEHDEAEEQHHHDIDPHWWHDVALFTRATRVIEQQLVVIAPQDAAAMAQRGIKYRRDLEQLERWVRQELQRIPREQRVLASTHAAFEYFCKAYQFESLPVQGVNREQVPSAVAMSAVIARLQTRHVRALFPEKESNPKVLATIRDATGLRLGQPLIADGAGVTHYADMVRYNVRSIVDGLSAP